MRIIGRAKRAPHCARMTKTRTGPDPRTRLNMRKTRVGIWARMGIVGIGHNTGQENLRRRSVERPEWKYQSQLGVLAGISLCKKYCIIFITIRVTLCPNVLLQDLKEESCFSILYYQAIKVCKPVLIIYCVCTFVVVSKSTV